MGCHPSAPRVDTNPLQRPPPATIRTMNDDAANLAERAPDLKAMRRLLLIAVIVGIVAAIGATAFLLVVHELQTLVFSSLPDAMGYASAPWWWAAILLLVGATLVAIAQRLPGHTGSGPLTGFHFDNPLQIVPSILLAAIASLVFGIALGPEAPLIVLGSALGLILLSRSNNAQAKQAGAFLGGTAAIGAVFGNPFITAFMILEFAAIGVAPGALVLPVLVALGASYLVQVGIWGIPFPVWARTALACRACRPITTSRLAISLVR